MLSVVWMLASLIKLSSGLKPHLVETLDCYHSTPIQQHFSPWTCSQLSFDDPSQSIFFTIIIKSMYCWPIHLAPHCQSPFAKYHSAPAFLQALHQQFSWNITHPGCYHWTPTLLVPFTSDEHVSSYTRWTSCSCLSRHPLGIRPPHFVHIWWNDEHGPGGLASIETEAYMGVIGKFIPKFRKWCQPIPEYTSYHQKGFWYFIKCRQGFLSNQIAQALRVLEVSKTKLHS
jgi:hypothetical protein